jgi:hypothetical protein
VQREAAARQSPISAKALCAEKPGLAAPKLHLPGDLVELLGGEMLPRIDLQRGVLGRDVAPVELGQALDKTGDLRARLRVAGSLRDRRLQFGVQPVRLGVIVFEFRQVSPLAAFEQRTQPGEEALLLVCGVQGAAGVHEPERRSESCERSLALIVEVHGGTLQSREPLLDAAVAGHQVMQRRVESGLPGLGIEQRFDSDHTPIVKQFSEAGSDSGHSAERGCP